MSVNRLEKLKEQLQRAININQEFRDVYKRFYSRKHHAVMQKYAKRTLAFVAVVETQIKLESEEEIEKYSDAEFEFILEEITNQIDNLEKDWKQDKVRMGISA